MGPARPCIQPQVVDAQPVLLEYGLVELRVGVTATRIVVDPARIADQRQLAPVRTEREHVGQGSARPIFRLPAT